MRRLSIEKIRQLLPQADSEVFSPDVFAQTGIFVIRKAIPNETMRLWLAAWEEFYTELMVKGRKVNPYNPVALDETPPEILADMHRHPALLDIVEKAFGPNIGLYNQRFVIKDQHSRGPVFLHQDYCYHIGWPHKASAFVSLSPMSPENGGLVFYPGTHHFGYLGDAGELNASVLPSDWPTLAPSLAPGDVALMNSNTWHRSGPHLGGPDRIMADIIYQPADDPSSIALVQGEWDTEIHFAREDRQNLFNRCRAKTVQELQRRLTELDPTSSHRGKN